MRVIETKVYLLNELSEDAKQKAYNKWLNTDREFFWGDEGVESIKKGLDFYGFSMGHRWRIDFSSANSSHVPIVSHHDYEIADLEGVRLWKYLQNNYATYWCKYQQKLRPTLEGNCPFTGYCVDESFLDPMREFIKKPTDITFKDLMDECVYAALKDIESDYDYQNTFEFFVSEAEENEWEFTEDGNLI